MEADLLDPASFESALQGSTYVCHVASPFLMETPKDEMEVIRPAVEGTKAVLVAAKAAGVRRVCLTSSINAICSVSGD